MTQEDHLSNKRYTEEFKVEAVKQITERGYSVSDVAQRLGGTTHSLYAWRNKYRQGSSHDASLNDQETEIKRLRAELKRVTEERDILKMATASSNGQRNTLLQLLRRGTKIQCFTRPLI